MNTRADNIAFRSVPLPQRGDLSAFGSARSTSERASRTRTSDERPSRGRSSRSSRHTTRLSEVGTADFGRSRLAKGESVSAYAGESGVVSVTRRHARWTVVSGEQGRDSRARRETRHEEPVANRRSFMEDYEEGPTVISGSDSRRSAIIGAMRAVPEAIGGAVLSVGSAAVRHVHTRGVMLMAGIAIAVAMLFSPVRDLYIAYRQLDTLQQTYDALSVENDGLRSQLETLQSREGIENEARARGFVQPGETKVIVEGITTEETTDGAAEAVAELELPDTRAWYIRLLDGLFGYDPAA